jgi:hypothetical protein
VGEVDDKTVAWEELKSLVVGGGGGKLPSKSFSGVTE